MRVGIIFTGKMISWLKDYFTVSKKERTGMLFLIFLIVMIWLLPKYFGRSDAKTLNVSAGNLSANRGKHRRADSVGVRRSFRLFQFDPNNTTDEQWLTLGLSEKNLRTVRNYLNKGGRFRHAEDIMKIYGLREDLKERLVPFVNIKTDVLQANRRKRTSPSLHSRNPWGANATDLRDRWGTVTVKGNSYVTAKAGDRRQSITHRAVIMLELNSADTAGLIDLPGIGPTLAKRIIVFREKCGGFYSLQQLAEVYGLKDSVFQRLRPRLNVDPKLVRMLQINRLGQDSLQLHPYISYSEAKAIVKYRSQHGPFRSSSDLLKVALITDEWVSRIAPYLDYSVVE